MDADTMPLLTIHGAALHAMAEGKPEEAAHITATLARRLRESESAGERDRQHIAQLTADFNELRLWVAQHVGAIDLEDVDGDVAQVLSSLDSIVLGNAGCTEQGDYTPEQWRVLQRCAVLAGEEDADNG